MFLGACSVAFSSALAAPFVFDDVPGIERNESIRQLVPLTIPLQPPRDTPVAGRPVVNISLAINYAINDWLGIDQDPRHGDSRRVLGYHALNILIHWLCALCLFAVVRRTLCIVGADWIEPTTAAGIATILWLVHPIQTEAVDYVIQRTELIVSLFYLLTLYCCIRAREVDSVNPPRRRWSILAVIAAAAGMASKEVMLTAPFAVVLYDRAFFATSWRDVFEAPRRRWRYAAIAATSIIVIAYVGSSARSQSVGFHLGLSWYEYARTQAWAIARYLRLIVWPSGLTFDYGDAPVDGLGSILGAIVLAPCLVGIVVAWSRPRWRWLAFAATFFFLVLVPSSSVVPIKTEIAAERRAYLASAAIFVIAAIAFELARHRFRLNQRTTLAATAGLAAVLAGCTFVRGLTFEDPEALYSDVIAKAPTNPRGYVGLGLAVSQHGPERLPEAAALFSRAVAVDSNSFPAWQSLGIASLLQMRWVEAAQAFRHVLRLEPGNLDAAAGMARATIQLGMPDSAAVYVERIGTADPEALWMLGEQLIALGRSGDAIRYLERSAAALPSGLAPALLSVAYAEVGRDSAAAETAEFAIQNSSQPAVSYVLAGRAMRLIRRRSEAREFLERALELDSTSEQARAELDSLRER